MDKRQRKTLKIIRNVIVIFIIAVIVFISYCKRRVNELNEEYGMRKVDSEARYDRCEFTTYSGHNNEGSICVVEKGGHNNISLWAWNHFDAGHREKDRMVYKMSNLGPIIYRGENGNRDSSMEMRMGELYLQYENELTGELSEEFAAFERIHHGPLDAISYDFDTFVRDGQLKMRMIFMTCSAINLKRQTVGAYIYNFSTQEYEYFVEMKYGEDKYEEYAESIGATTIRDARVSECVWSIPEIAQIDDYYYDNEVYLSQMLLLEPSFKSANGFDTKGDTELTTIKSWQASGGILFEIDCAMLPDKSEVLYSEFPELEAYKNSEYKENGVGFVLQEQYNAEDIMQMLIGDDRQVSYEGVYISEEYSIDGQRHDISSYEEYMMYLDPSSMVYATEGMLGKNALWGKVLNRYIDDNARQYWARGYYDY